LKANKPAYAQTTNSKNSGETDDETKRSIDAMISVDSVDQARAFYHDKRGFGHLMGMLGKDGQLDFCTVTLGGARYAYAANGENEGIGLTSSNVPSRFI